MKSDRRIWRGLLLGVALLVGELQASDLSPAELEAVERIVVVGDVHGNFDGFRTVLEQAGVIDRRGRWRGGRTQLVQLGDIPDRGDQSLEASEYLQRLPKKARRKGGGVHVLIGNHEAMNIYGDLRYVDPGEYAEFRSGRSEELLEVVYENEIAAIKAHRPEEEWPVFDEAFRKKWYAQRPPGWVEHRLSWQEGEMSEWVRSRNTVLRIGRTLFVHGGLGATYADWSIARINQAVRDALAKPANVADSILRDPEGPLWYRGLAWHEEALEEAHVEALLEQYDVDRIVLGHTVTHGIIFPRFGGRVILADVGISKAYGENLSCLIIEGDTLTAVHRDGEVRVPVDYDEAELIDYVDQVSRLEPDNRYLKRRLQELRNPPSAPETESAPTVADPSEAMAAP